jgi:hypothetical protein
MGQFVDELLQVFARGASEQVSIEYHLWCILLLIFLTSIAGRCPFRGKPNGLQCF